MPCYRFRIPNSLHFLEQVSPSSQYLRESQHFLWGWVRWGWNGGNRSRRRLPISQCNSKKNENEEQSSYQFSGSYYCCMVLHRITLTIQGRGLGRGGNTPPPKIGMGGNPPPLTN